MHSLLRSFQQQGVADFEFHPLKLVPQILTFTVQGHDDDPILLTEIEFHQTAAHQMGMRRDHALHEHRFLKMHVGEAEIDFHRSLGGFDTSLRVASGKMAFQDDTISCFEDQTVDRILDPVAAAPHFDQPQPFHSGERVALQPAAHERTVMPDNGGNEKFIRPFAVDQRGKTGARRQQLWSEQHHEDEGAGRESDAQRSDLKHGKALQPFLLDDAVHDKIRARADHRAEAAGDGEIRQRNKVARWCETGPPAQAEHHRDEHDDDGGIIQESADADGEDTETKQSPSSPASGNALEPVAKSLHQSCAFHGGTHDEHEGDRQNRVVAENAAQNSCLRCFVRREKDRAAIEGNDEQQKQSPHGHDVRRDLFPNEHPDRGQREKTDKQLIWRHGNRERRWTGASAWQTCNCSEEACGIESRG